MEVRIHGPNLVDQSKGQFQVHSAECADNARVRYFGGVLRAEEQPMTVEVETKRDAVEYVYEDQLAEGSPYQGCRDDLYFNPCCSDLKEEK